MPHARTDPLSLPHPLLSRPPPLLHGTTRFSPPPNNSTTVTFPNVCPRPESERPCAPALPLNSPPQFFFFKFRTPPFHSLPHCPSSCRGVLMSLSRRPFRFTNHLLSERSELPIFIHVFPPLVWCGAPPQSEFETFCCNLLRSPQSLPHRTAHQKLPSTSAVLSTSPLDILVFQLL